MIRITLIVLLVVFSKMAIADSTGDTLQVGFLVLPSVYNSELMAPYDVFHHTQFHTKPGMRVFTVALDEKPVTTFEGITIQPNYSLENAPKIDVLVIPSAEHNMDSDLQNAKLKAWVRHAAESARYVITLCDGAFVLANTGLLDGVQATTFPTDVARFRQLFPKVRTLEGYSFVQDGKFLTSQGGAKSYDVAMHLVDRLYGEKVAAGIGKGLVIPWRNPDIKFFMKQ